MSNRVQGRFIYLVAPTEKQGLTEAEERGWIKNAAWNYVTPQKNLVKVVWRYDQFLPFAGVTPMIKGSDYETGPPPDDRMAWLRWAGAADNKAQGDVGDKARFDRFVADGHGQWVEG